MGFTVAAAQKLDLPAFPADTGGGDGFGWGRGDAPAGDGRRRAVDQILFGNHAQTLCQSQIVATGIHAHVERPFTLEGKTALGS